MSRTVLDLEEWELVLAKMHRHHANVAQEVAIIVQTIRKEMKSELVPLAEEKATYGKVQSCPFLCLQSDKKNCNKNIRIDTIFDFDLFFLFP